MLPSKFETNEGMAESIPENLSTTYAPVAQLPALKFTEVTLLPEVFNKTCDPMIVNETLEMIISEHKM